MDLLSFIQVTDPTKVKVGEQERAEEEAKLLDSTVGRVVTLLPVSPARSEIVPTLPMVSSSMSATPEHESDIPADSITGLDIRTIGAPERYAVVPLVRTEAVVTSHAVNIPPVPEIGVKVTSHVHASLFQDSDSMETLKADTAGPSYSAKQDLSMDSRVLNSENLH
nr:hypothetical protein [Tanacetum cinerariifolium]